MKHIQMQMDSFIYPFFLRAFFSAPAPIPGSRSYISSKYELLSSLQHLHLEE